MPSDPTIGTMRNGTLALPKLAEGGCTSAGRLTLRSRRHAAVRWLGRFRASFCATLRVARPQRGRPRGRGQVDKWDKWGQASGCRRSNPEGDKWGQASVSRRYESRLYTVYRNDPIPPRNGNILGRFSGVSTVFVDAEGSSGACQDR
jgi:hypothetical protein